ncbi:MAG: xylulokinase [Acidimicrobiia bacterium]|nr:xylulokinase [Acidimicrobiia bacterium]
MSLVLGVDSSTQATKVEVRDADDGSLVASGRAAHPPTSPPRSEQDPEAWFRALGSAVGMALGPAGTNRVDALAVAGQQHGMVVLDAAGRVVRPAKLWNDTESAPQAAALVTRLGAEAWVEATGLVPVASFTISKLAWLAENEPENLARLATLLLPHDWLTWRLTGRFVTDRGDASGTGYWSPATNAWRTDLLDLVGTGRDWTQALPAVLGPVEVAGELTCDVGLAPGAAVGPGTGDNMAAALALGLRPGDVVFSLGTSGTVFGVTHDPVADRTGAVAGFADAAGGFLPLVCTLNCMRVTDWVAGLLGCIPADLDRLAAGTEPGARGVTLVPYLDGERTPNRPDATGSLWGLGTSTTPADVARAAYEGVVCSLLDARDALAAAGVAVDGRVFLVGGGARSAVFRQTLADLAQCAVVVPAADELVAAGACVQAGAVRSGREPGAVAADWGLAAGQTVEAGVDSDTATRIRLRYAAKSDKA